MRAGAFAVIVLAMVIAGTGVVAQQSRQGEVDLQAAIRTETFGDLRTAIQQYEKVIARYPKDRALVANALLRMARCYQTLGDNQARRIYERVANEFRDQAGPATTARAFLNSLAAGNAGPVPRHIWSSPAVDSYGSVSSDGGLISYTDWSTGNLAIHDVRTGQDRALTDKKDWNSPEFAIGSAISPDGRQVAYGWLLITPARPLEDHFAEVRLIDVNGGKSRVLFRSRDMSGVHVYDWMNDGKSLLIRLEGVDDTTQIVVLSAADGALRVLKSFKSGDVSNVAISPDGKYVAYDYSSGGDATQRQVHFAAVADGSQDTALAKQANDRVLGWSPDGTHLVFASERSGLPGIWTVGLRDGKPAGEPDLVKSNVNPASLGMTRSGALYYAVAASGRDIYVASADFDSGRILSAPAVVPMPYIGVNDYPRWSPDGKSLAYLALKNSNSKSEQLTTIIIRSMETGSVRELTPTLRYLLSSDKGRPLWTSDGAFIVAGVDKQGRNGIYRLDAKNGETTALVLGRVGQVSLSAQALSADGRILYFKRRLPESASEAVFALDLQSRAERELLRRNHLGDVVLSPDGRWLATTANEDRNSTLLLIPVAGGEPRELLRIADPETFGNFVAWLPDNKTVLFRRFPKGATRREPWRISIDGGAVREIDLNGLLGPNPSIHPDGRQFAFVNGEPKLEIWALENFLSSAKAAR